MGKAAASQIMSTSSTASKYWIAVASAEHVRRGRSEGFMQVNHGKQGPLKRIQESKVNAAPWTPSSV